MVSDSDIHVIVADANRKRMAGMTHMAMRTETAIELGGKELLRAEDLTTYEAYEDAAARVNHTSQVEVAKVLAAVESHLTPLVAE